jgi:hypothetical protein
MIKHFFPNPVVFERLRAGLLGDHIDAFGQGPTVPWSLCGYGTSR